VQNFSDLVQEKQFHIGVERREVGSSVENWPYFGNGER